MDGSRRKKTNTFSVNEKRNREITSMNKLIINGVAMETPKDVGNFGTQFYSNLHSSLNQPNNIDFFSLSNLTANINQIRADFSNSRDKEFIIQEVTDCINGLKDNKSPGNDGLTEEFLTHFVMILNPFNFLFSKNQLIWDNFLFH